MRTRHRLRVDSWLGLGLGRSLQREIPMAMLGLCALACQGKPLPLVAPLGSTVFIPIGSGGAIGTTAEGSRMGYGTESAPDFQRGRLRLWLDVDPQGDAGDVELAVRSVGRAAPDPASPSGIGIDALGNVADLAGQVVVVADVPDATAFGGVELPAEFGVYARRYVPQWNGMDWSTEAQVSPAPAYEGRLTILDSEGASTPFEARVGTLWWDTTPYLPEFVPLPRLRFEVSASATSLGAVRLLVAYPSSRVAIRAVLADPLNDAKAWGRGALVSFSEDTPGLLEIRAVVPGGVVRPVFGLVFELTHPEDPPTQGGGPVTLSDFTFSTVEAWDLNGAAVSASVTTSSKKIL
jgi:hypothetical protein